MPLPAIERYQFGPYRMDSGERLLHRGEELVSLPPKAAGTLFVLVQNAGRMVDKSTLMQAVWPDTFVEEGVLARNISLLRKALGDTAETSTFIETVPKRGYRFIAPVRTEPGGNGAPLEAAERPPLVTGPRVPRWAAAFVYVALIGLPAILLYAFAGRKIIQPPSPTAGDRALAILPFRNLDRNNAPDYFAEGLTQALISSLANLRKVRVVSLASQEGGNRDAAAWSEILGDQSVHQVLTGSILRSGNRVRIDAQLIDPATRAVHWAKSYERDETNVLALESAVAEAIAGEIQVSMTSEDRERLRRQAPARAEALDAYLQGRYLWNRRTEDSLRQAIQHFQQAIALDPKYALAYTGLADSYAILGSVGTDGMPPNQAMPLAKAAARKALALDPNLADAHVSLGYILFSYDWDLPAAGREFARALALNPNSATGRHWYAHYFMAAADLTQASEQMREAAQLEPLSPSINIGIGWCLYYSRQFDQAIQRFRSVAEMDPSLPLAHQTLGMAYQQNGEIAKAIEEYKRAAAFSNNSPASVAALAGAYAAAGQSAEAKLELARLEEMSRTRYVPAFYFATVHFALGDLGRTFRWGWTAIGERCDYLMYLRVEPRVGKLAGNPEFIRALAALRKR
jgi:DNA-binding winged helix-turn-helix (wHTH) protein/TolB-like protein